MLTQRVISFSISLYLLEKMAVSMNTSLKTLLASQPIYTAERDLFGFELLFRHAENLSASEFGDDLATSDVLLNLCTGISEHFEFFSRPMFINLSENFLNSDAFLPLPPEGTVIDLPRSIKIDADMISAIKKRKEQGFSFALDNFGFESRYQPLLELVDYIKVDVLHECVGKLAVKLAEYQQYQVKWAALRVEKEKQFLDYSDLGFELFQGYFLARPLPVEGHKIRANLHNSIGTINAVNQPDIGIDELTDIVSKDPALAAQILKIVNSPACSLIRTISSIKDAVNYLGLIQVRKWAIMMAMLNDSQTSPGAMRLILTRAKACENYATTSPFANPDHAFLVGLLSGIQLLFGVKNDIFIEKIRLQSDIETAVLTHGGILGQILNEVLRTERSIMVKLSAPPPNCDELYSSYSAATNWSEKVLLSNAI